MKKIICCIAKDEQVFINEWVDYHLKIGFDLIYIYEDFGSSSHSYLFTDDKYLSKVTIIPIEKSILGIENTHSPMTQLNLYKKFLLYCKDLCLADYLLFSDIDEFLMFEDDWDLNRLCDFIKDKPSVYLCWKIYNADSHILTPHPEVGVLDAYHTTTQEKLNPLQFSVKSLINVLKNTGLTSVHCANGGALTNGKNVDTQEYCYDKAWINHYYTKSFEDYCNRIFKRGNMHNNFRTFDLFFRLNPQFANLESLLLQQIREKHTVCSTWISRKYRIISGGNLARLEELKQKYYGRL